MDKIIDFRAFKARCQRKDYLVNNANHWFSSNFSVYFSYFFFRIKLSADQVTIVFFLVGLFGSFFYSFNSIIFSILGYLLFRLHIIIDMSDGDIARFNQSFSIRGAYWDAVIHSIVNPCYYVLISFSFYLQFNNDLFLILGGFTGMSSSVLMAVKNNYYKAMLLNNEPYKNKHVKNLSKTSLKFKLFFLVSEVLSIEGFVLLTVCVRSLNIESTAIALILLYLGSNTLISAVKFYQLSYKGYYMTKS